MPERVREKKENRKRHVVAIALLSLLLFFSPLPSFCAVEEEYVGWDIPADKRIPPIPTNLGSTTGNFYINYTWEPGDALWGYTETDSYNISYWVNANHHWDNTTNTTLNETAGAHGWLNISQLWAYNTSYTNLSDGYIYQNVQIPNNPITITNTSGWSGDEDELVYLDFDYTDLDGDTGAFTTTATKGSLNGATGVFEWQTTLADDGVYHWWFNVSDGYGSSDSYSATITVNDLGDIINLTSWYNNYTCDNSTSFTIPHEDADNRTVFFNVTAEQNMDWWWYVDGELYQNTSVASNTTNVTKTWDFGGNKTVSIYGTNANGQTPALTWYIEIEYTQYEYAKLIYSQNQVLIEEEKMMGLSLLLSLLVIVGMVFFLLGIIIPHGVLTLLGSMTFFVTMVLPIPVLSDYAYFGIALTSILLLFGLVGVIITFYQFFTTFNADKGYHKWDNYFDDQYSR